MSRRSTIRSCLIVGLVLASSPPALAERCLDRSIDFFQVKTARTAIKAACGCFSFASRAQYVACAKDVAGARVASGQLRSECFRLAKADAAVSVCGKPIGRHGPPVPCVSLDGRGRAVCRIKPAGRCATPCPGSISCASAGDDDGDFVAGRGDSGFCRAPAPLVDNGDGTLSDGETGLQWERLDDAGGLHDKDAAFSWDDAVGVKILQLNLGGGFAGHDDWRLPTVAELYTLVRPGASPAVASAMNAGCVPDCTECSCTRPDFHWSSTLVSYDPARTWAVFFGAGTAAALDRAGFALNVRAVRSPP